MPIRVPSPRVRGAALFMVMIGAGSLVRGQEPPNLPVAGATLKVGDNVNILINHLAEGGDSPSQDKFWIGLMCTPIGDALRSQLGLTDTEGLVVEEVREASPAAKSGIQRYDVLIRAIVGQTEPRPLSATQHLSAAVQAAAPDPLKLELVRRGQRQTVEIVPQERPNSLTVETVEVASAAGHAVGLRWMGPMYFNVTPPLPPGTTVEFRPTTGSPQEVTVKQGDKSWEVKLDAISSLPAALELVVEQQLAARQRSAVANTVVLSQPPLVAIRRLPPLPANVTLTIVREGDKPATVTIRRDGKTFEAVETDLSKLPADVRLYAQNGLNPSPGAMVPGPHPITTTFPHHLTVVSSGAPGHPQVAVMQEANARIREAKVRTEQSRKDLEVQVRALAEQVEKLREAVEKGDRK